MDKNQEARLNPASSRMIRPNYPLFFFPSPSSSFLLIGTNFAIPIKAENCSQHLNGAKQCAFKPRVHSVYRLKGLAGKHSISSLKSLFPRESASVARRLRSWLNSVNTVSHLCIFHWSPSRSLVQSDKWSVLTYLLMTGPEGVAILFLGFLFVCFFLRRITIDFLTFLSFVSVAPFCPEIRNKCESERGFFFFLKVLLWPFSP